MAKKAFKSSSVQKENQKRFLDAWFASEMSMTGAIKELKIYNLTTHYKYMQDPEYAAKIALGADKTERKCDIIEDVLFEKARAGNFPAIKLWLETHGKPRGYGKQIEDKQSINIQRAVVQLEAPMDVDSFAEYGVEALKTIPNNEEEVAIQFKERIGDFDMENFEAADLYAE